WILVSGLIDAVLGAMIWLDWPVSAIWVPGLFVGISLLFRGFNWISLGILLGGQRVPPERPADGRLASDIKRGERS
ncbi:MAG: hypothetical protein JO244_12890, partial [Solirubrobacterales bacterium]|nr:hypothetical protein [Solirubrobacterales bacterium]